MPSGLSDKVDRLTGQVKAEKDELARVEQDKKSLVAQLDFLEIDVKKANANQEALANVLEGNLGGLMPPRPPPPGPPPPPRPPPPQNKHRPNRPPPPLAHSHEKMDVRNFPGNPASGIPLRL